MKTTLLKFAIFLLIVGLIGFYLFRFMDSADKNKNESASIGTILSIIAVQKDLGCDSLQELIEKQLIDSKLNDGKKAGYIFTITKTEKKCEISSYPESEIKGGRSFYSSNEDNWKIHFSKDLNQKANINSPILNTTSSY